MAYFIMLQLGSTQNKENVLFGNVPQSRFSSYSSDTFDNKQVQEIKLEQVQWRKQTDTQISLDAQ